MSKIIFSYTLLLVSFSFAKEVDLKTTKLYNETAYITSQCYTKTFDENTPHIVHNPCYSCHVKNKEPNYTLYDDDLQLAYDFPLPAFKNHWTNLFKDRTKDIEKISDENIMKYVREDNYIKNKEIVLSKKLQNLPKEWDFNDNGKWDGYIPDCYFNFDSEGFDKDPKGDYTLWRAFAYSPFLGTFWPTNGSSDDVIIRLAKPFTQNSKGVFDKEVYNLNLLIVESLIKQQNIKIDPTDEKKYGVDLNQNGKLDMANEIVFLWNTPKYNNDTLKIENFSMSYVGKAKELLKSNEYLIAPGLYPKDTEFLHSVRYIDFKNNGNNEEIKIAPRMKELRYGKKTTWHSYFQLSNAGMETIKEKTSTPDATEVYVGNIETGFSNKIGWYFQGFIENSKGDLRPQSYEETLYCMGCHGNIGATTDSTFAYARKLEYNSFQKGWYHWTQKGLKGIPDRKLPNGQTEYVRYLEQNNAGDEFRQNEEIIQKFFTNNLKLKKQEANKIKSDISYLILPSKQRALKLNKAYKVIVDEQSYIYGRDTHIKPTKNLHKNIKDGQITGIKEPIK